MTSLSFNNLTVVSFESRMALPMQRLIEKFGGKAMVAPSMKEVPLENNQKAFSFFQDMMAGKVDLFILMTGIALRTFLKVLESRHAKEDILQTLSTKTKIVVRGPKPKAVCAMNNIPIAITVPEPNTWREILTILKNQNLLAGKNVAVLEYGISNHEFLEELQDAGAHLTPVPVYAWELPDDMGPLNNAIDSIIDGQVDMALFTSANQVDHVFRVVRERDLESPFRRALHKVAIASIGPVCSERLVEYQIFPDVEAKPNKMDDLVSQAASASQEILAKKKGRAERSWVYLESPHTTLTPEARQMLRDSLVMKACRREKNTRIPVWLMRQAGRYMTEYQNVRLKAGGFKQLCTNPHLAAEATLDAAERLGVDAAIIFSDILFIAEAMGQPLEYRESVGPLLGNPVRTTEDVENLKLVDMGRDMPFVLDAIRQVRAHLHPRIPLIGFAGAPFTIASYMIEGHGSRNYIPTKGMMHGDSKTWHRLMEKITASTIDYLNAQVEAGCQLVQIFDSWVSALTPSDYEEYVLPHSQRLISSIKKDIPVIHFGSFSSGMLPLMKKAGGDVMSLDWRMDIKQAWDQLGKEMSVQGNLDPAILFSSPDVIRKEADKILNAVGDRPGFIFNLGHGILPETPVDHVMELVDHVHRWRARA